jgi:3-methylcrotonyl-CoA carboxylase alpha subunit
MITSLLIANRGEIACRIIRTARAMNIRTIAVYSDADAKALHVRSADEAVHIGPSPARESYLVGANLIAAAKATGAEAIHPGYGFLSENADFAQSVIDAGLIWVGPHPDSIRAMGLKDAAKSRMIAAGVPVTPGYLGGDQAPATLKAEAEKIGYPILIKAVAGGGGKGMRRIDAASAFDDALDSCQREAASSFGDDRVLLERYVLSPRHIEVQIFGDTHGNVVHLFERDCSLQRRHQKVIEEAPAPGMDPATREAICAAAVKAAKAVDYVGAGTIEFIADASEGLRADRIWFMEMNTRLQVEHPVTEEITGVDLVEWQLRVASGEPLPKRQDELSINGWAIEARLYAEDPAKGFLPSVGRLDEFVIPAMNDVQVRIERGFERGDVISQFYDPMIAKIIVHAEDRETARHDLADTCAGVECWPVKTNAGFLMRALNHEGFVTANITTAFIAQNEQALLDTTEVFARLSEDAAIALVASEIHPTGTVYGSIKRELQTSSPGNIWREAIGFRMNAPQSTSIAIAIGNEPSRIVEFPPRWMERWTSSEDVADGIAVFDEGEALFVRTRFRASLAAVNSSGALIAPMPGKVTAVDVTPGATVTKGQRILTLEAMKMEHALVAPFDGTVAELTVEAGAQVQVDALLARIEPAAIPAAPAGV